MSEEEQVILTGNCPKCGAYRLLMKNIICGGCERIRMDRIYYGIKLVTFPLWLPLLTFLGVINFIMDLWVARRDK